VDHQTHSPTNQDSLVVWSSISHPKHFDKPIQQVTVMWRCWCADAALPGSLSPAVEACWNCTNGVSEYHLSEDIFICQPQQSEDHGLRGWRALI